MFVWVFLISYNLIVGSTGTCFLHGSSFLTYTTSYLIWDWTSFASLASISVNSLFAFSMPTHSQQLKLGLILINLTIILGWLLFSISRRSSRHNLFWLYLKGFTESILRFRGFKFVQVNNHTLTQREIITK